MKSCAWGQSIRLSWCAANGHDPLLRIALCGHAGEHDALLDHGWVIGNWTARKGYALNKMCFSFNSADNRASFKQDEEAYMRLYQLTGPQAAAIRARNVLQLPTVGDKSFLITIGDRSVGGTTTVNDIEHIEGTSYTRAFTAVNAAKTDNKALAVVERGINENPDLDPQRKATLLAQVDGYRASNEARALRQAQHAEIVGDALDGLEGFQIEAVIVVIGHDQIRRIASTNKLDPE